MNVVISGSTYQIYDEGMQTAKHLPALVYDVNFSKMQGFFLTSRLDLRIEEEKVYGSYGKKVSKVLSGYKMVNRNFGAILSGPKGVGKTLFTKVLSVEAKAQGYPVIIVSQYIPGIAQFLSSIDQDVIVLFDEFEKTFAKIDNINPQEEMLTLFDGLDSGHKLFIVTCNETNDMSSYLFNRPGRFHYHFVFNTPSAEEIREYLMDKLAPSYQNVIDQVINFSFVGKITYDVLRAIAFELNSGYSLEETLMDLNISRDKYSAFDIEITFSDGAVYKIYNANINMLRTDEDGRWYNTSRREDGESIYLSFRPLDLECDPNEQGKMFVPLDKITSCRWDPSDVEGEKNQEVIAAIMNERVKHIKSVILKRSLGYADMRKYIV